LASKLFTSTRLISARLLRNHKKGECNSGDNNNKI
jgi:hypothetical protein